MAKKKQKKQDLNGVFVNYRQSRHVIHPKHAIIKVDGIETRKQALGIIGYKVDWMTETGKTLTGKINKAHGKKGLVIANFKNGGLPGQAMGTSVTVRK